jgi:MFS family permease
MSDEKHSETGVEIKPAQPQSEAKEKRAVMWRLFVFFACLYMADGLFQSGVYSQPLTNYMKSSLGWAPDHVTAYFTAFSLPWVIKPLYGIFSDFVPLFGYRRKSYLLGFGTLGALAFAYMSQISDPHQIMVPLMLANISIAASTTLCGGVMVENGKKYAASGSFVNQQWSWFFFATVLGSLAGGWLADRQLGGFQLACLVLSGTMVGTALASWFTVREEKSKIDVAGLKASFAALGKAFKTRNLWLIGGFIFLYNYSPSFGTPLYYYQIDKLHFSQEFIGALGAIGAGASVVGGALYAWLQKRLTMKQLLNSCIFVGMLGQLSYLLLAGEPSALVLTIVNGVMGMVTIVAVMTVAADFCPDGAEGFSYAVLMSIYNIASQASANSGALMYVHVFHNQLNPLIIVSAAFTALAFILVPFLRLGKRMPGEKAKFD